MNAKTMPICQAPRWVLMLALSCGLAHADGHEGRPRTPLPQSKPYVQECGACHLAYPPQLLPAASWSRLMAGLPRHFGTDASLDDRDLQVISQWLQANADQRRTSTPPADANRITRTAWFERKHRRIEAATWRLPAIRAASNCLACHAGAEQGQFDEHALRMPAGLSPRQRAAWDD